MLVVVSPAKRLDWDVPTDGMTLPRLSDQAALLAARGRELSVNDLKKLMGLSDKLARLNYDRFGAMAEENPDDLRPAALAFAGDTYTGLEMATLDDPARDFAADHLRILSGLYGVLRPMDGIRPYRLEMGTRLSTERGKNLYEFWGSRIAEQLRKDAQVAGSAALLNCASTEYFGAVDTDALGLPVITPRFLDEKSGVAKVISFHAKKARGAMARFVCENRITDPAALRDFDLGGYTYVPEDSTEAEPVFFRSEKAATAAA
ncbi:peroxide stress protein YaaA [Palleronia caenipelagi]|uniref:UPF0246 protein FEV53_02960 n=1 Tax=Palleronia caenipelagi TaxID=2489174 RepID=A0A547Q8R1_9RHOB|nr:peroxide stress protein YaaA [Palleronia caenipelagi]TRD22761.1 peroxide stress protein YaaA [Palleronia caenipelagi]